MEAFFLLFELIAMFIYEALVYAFTYTVVIVFVAWVLLNYLYRSFK